MHNINNMAQIINGPILKGIISRKSLTPHALILPTFCETVPLKIALFTVKICALRYPTRFTLIAHFKNIRVLSKLERKMLVLDVWLGAHLQEIHCWCQQKVCSVNGLIMEDVQSTKDTGPSRTSGMTHKRLRQCGFVA
jgi:hypothetical protein